MDLETNQCVHCGISLYDFAIAAAARRRERRRIEAGETPSPPLSWNQRCIFTAAIWEGAWWLDRINPDGRTRAAAGPYPDELTALRAANEMNRLNQGWIEHDQ